MRLLRIVPDDTKFDFMRFRRISFPISALMSILAISLYFFHGLNFGIDFKGGTLIEVQTKAGDADLAKMRATLASLGLGEVQLQQFGAPNDVLIRIAEQPGGDAAQQEAVTKVRGALGNEYDYRRVEVVGPRVSGELLSYGVIGLGLAILCILVYLWFRFEWQFALGAMIANVHDIVLTIGFMSITQIDFDLTSIAALLTILGYSLNDTVVIYDRIREMLRRYKKMPMTDLLNTSINSTLSRSVITHVTVSLALLALLLFGGQPIHSFTATMMFGVGETVDQRINHFEVVHRLQEETGGFTAFIPWSFQPKHTALGGRGWEEATSVEYLKVLAISRLYLDNIENVQASWVTQGLKVLEVGLHFGGNDVGSVMLEENVVKAAGTSNCTTEEELRRIIRDAGFKPVQRDTLYRTMFLN